MSREQGYWIYSQTIIEHDALIAEEGILGTFKNLYYDINYT